jgi:hypothetical protein
VSVNFNTTNSLQIPGPITSTASQGALTIMCWIRMNALPVGAQIYSYYGYAIGTSGGGLRIGLGTNQANSGSFRIAARGTDTDAITFFQTGNGLLVPGSWQHLVGVINYATHDGAVFVNGVSQSVAVTTGNNMTGTTSGAASSSLGKIGCNITNNTTELCNGLIEDCRLYKRVLSSNEIMTIYSSAGRDGIVDSLGARYPLNDQSQSTTVLSVADIAGIDHVVGTNPTANPATFDVSIMTPRRRRHNFSLTT